MDDGITCVRCLDVLESADLDRLLWCEACRLKARARAAAKGWWVGGAVGGLLALYVWIVVEPSDRLVGGWIGVILAGSYLAARMAREILFGVERIQNVKAVEAVPPGEQPPDEEDEPPRRISFRG